nr:MAG TPA: hypothetical protein [Caudoviricetes sp.]
MLNSSLVSGRTRELFLHYKNIIAQNIHNFHNFATIKSHINGI